MTAQRAPGEIDRSGFVGWVPPSEPTLFGEIPRTSPAQQTWAGQRGWGSWRPADLVVTVHGIPTPAGSKSAFPARRKVEGEWVPTGKLNYRDGKTAKSAAAHKDWREAVRSEAQHVVEFGGGDLGGFPFGGALACSLTFSIKRPDGLPARKRIDGMLVEVRHRPAKRPDLLKYARAVEDSLTQAGAFKDDAQVTEYWRLGKWYAGDGARYGELDVLDVPGVVIRVWRI